MARPRSSPFPAQSPRRSLVNFTEPNDHNENWAFLPKKDHGGIYVIISFLKCTPYVNSREPRYRYLHRRITVFTYPLLPLFKPVCQSFYRQNKAGLQSIIAGGPLKIPGKGMKKTPFFPRAS